MTVRHRQLVTHIVGGFAFLAVPILFSPDFSLSLRIFSIPPFQRNFITYVLLLFFFYINYFVLLPELYFKKKYLWFVLSLVLFYIIISAVPGFLIRGALPPDLAATRPPRPPHGFWDFGHHFPQFLIVVMFSLMIKINSRWKESEKQKLNAELSYLKAQINPHFLFNSLNSIYSLAISRSDNTGTAVVKLSDMMRYVISDAARDHVPLDKEINYITDYIDMQKLRLGDTVRLSYVLDVRGADLEIAPLILIPFIENAFKYGVNPEEDSHILISLSTSGRVLTLIVDNNKVAKNMDDMLRSGLGLTNAQSRLKFIYPGKHELVIKEDEHKFHVNLSVNL
ncbi:MAG: hypothetical protein JWO03_2206 [Bacteroidetes bacterium]|nr:hypothetical protein [Bacteroidota bacterium]